MDGRKKTFGFRARSELRSTALNLRSWTLN